MTLASTINPFGPSAGTLGRMFSLACIKFAAHYTYLGTLSRVPLSFRSHPVRCCNLILLRITTHHNFPVHHCNRYDTPLDTLHNKPKPLFLYILLMQRRVSGQSLNNLWRLLTNHTIFSICGLFDKTVNHCLLGAIDAAPPPLPTPPPLYMSDAYFRFYHTAETRTNAETVHAHTGIYRHKDVSFETSLACLGSP